MVFESGHFGSRGSTTLRSQGAVRGATLHRAALVTLLSIGLLLAAPLARADEAPLFAGADVVVLTGLPGDVESETAYDAQIGRLLEVFAAAPERPGRVFLLTDSGAAPPVPPGIDHRVAVGNRKGWQELAGELGGSGRPLVVVAWGHGGLQGRDPVFHVRGPRLTPSDFASLAAAAGDGGSRWVLLFRSSGAFARAVRAPGREILSSENEVAFQSDPVGVDLMLEILKTDPSASLATFGERLGAATVDWYSSQHLARTEEPTLWHDRQAPVQVATRVALEKRAAEEEAARLAAVAEAETPQEEVAEETAVAAATVPADAGLAWADLEPVSPGDYPGAAAVVLRRSVSYTLASSPALSHESDEFIQILRPEGERWGDFDVAYSPPGEKITFLDCEVLLPGGNLVRLDPSEIRDATPQALAGYRPATRKIFSMPQVAAGAVLRVHYRREWQRFPLPHIPLEVPLAAEIPIVDSRLAVRVPRDSPLHHTFDATARRLRLDQQVEVGHTEYGTTYTWQFEDVAPTVTESLSPPGADPRLRLSTFPSWDAFSRWYHRLIQLADEPTPEIIEQARLLTHGTRTDRDKVRAIYDFVTSLRYVAIPLGVNSHRPHAAGRVLANRYGDCKDKANLFNTLLGTIGVHADLVLVPRFTQADEATPGLAFNHAISRVELADEVIWADTTDDVCRFGMLPPGDPGRKVLVVREGEDSLTELPRPRPEDHRLIVMASVTVDGSAGAAAKFDMTSAGFPDYRLRLAARSAAGRGRNRPLVGDWLHPTAGVFELASQSHTAVAALDRDFAWSGEGRSTGLSSALPGAGGGPARRLLRAPFWLPAEWQEALHDRTAPLFLSSGYPLTLYQEVELVLPAGAGDLALPEPRAEESGPIRWRVEWNRNDDSPVPRVTASLELELTTGEIGPEETPVFQRQLRGLYDALGTGVIYGLRD
ncbi:MAG: DUF3857 and transglutaminase domain-containing protein [bacterium]|nr:DUF3857 and transglutaminase domain-containing protein [bacterium]